MKNYSWINPWKSIKINCPWCGAYQVTDGHVVVLCFYCYEEFLVGVDGAIFKGKKK